MILFRRRSPWPDRPIRRRRRLSPSARLSDATLDRVPPGVARPAYDRAGVTIGVVHLGPGAFHRAHQAAYVERLLARDPRWGICAVSLKSPGVREALAPQDGLYTLVELDAEPSLRMIGALKEILVAAEDAERVLSRLASPQTGLVTLTVTEKGYRLGADGRLDLAHPDIVHDRAKPPVPASAVGWLVEGLRRRRHQGGELSILSCDNLVGNGRKLAAAVLALAEAQGEPDLAAWIERNVAFPNSMVDSITPATDEALREQVRERLGLADAWPVQRERFTQWVVEDRLKANAPDLAAVGVQLTADVRPFEQAKLRLLNGAHSSLAYLGALMGLDSVAEATAEPRLAGFVESLMRRDIAPSLAPPAEFDLDLYVTAILQRFRNPAIRHRLSQIAWDGSQKVPVRLLGTIEDALRSHRPVGRLSVPVAAWMAFVVGRARAGADLVDPMAEDLTALGAAVGEAPEAAVARFLELETVFPRALARAPAFRAAVTAAYAALARGEFPLAQD